MAASQSQVSCPFISVVVPVFEDGACLETLVATVCQELDALACTYELIIVDDGSQDETWSIVQHLSQTVPALRGIRLSRNFGKESAVCAGLERAQGDAVIVMDADLQHPPHLIPQMIAHWQAGDGDIVEAVKSFRGEETYMNKLGATVFYALLNRLTGYNLSNASDYKLLDRKVLDAWMTMREHNLFFKGMTAWLGFHRVEIPFDVNHRIGSHSKWSLLALVNLAVTAITAFSALPLHSVSIIGVIFLLFAFPLAVQTLYHKLAGLAVDGFTTVILLQLIIGSILMISLGIMGEYLARIYTEVKGRPRYVVTELLNPKAND